MQQRRRGFATEQLQKGPCLSDSRQLEKQTARCQNLHVPLQVGDQEGEHLLPWTKDAANRYGHHFEWKTEMGHSGHHPQTPWIRSRIPGSGDSGA